MKIWLLENGERTGPHEIFTIRDRISSGELKAETSAWYEGADGWVTLAEVPAYASYFKKERIITTLEDEKINSELVESLEKQLSGSKDVGSPFDSRSGNFSHKGVVQHEELYPIRRFFARMLDISLYTILLYIFKVKVGINPLVVESMAKELLFQLPYLLLDGLALAYIGTTPGKWLLNIDLRRSDGQYLEVATSLIRSARVWVLGFAMQSPFVVLSLPFSWFIGNKYGKFIWDLPKNNITRCGPLTPAGIIGYVLVVIVSSYILKYSIPAEFMPTLENWKTWNQK